MKINESWVFGWVVPDAFWAHSFDDRQGKGKLAVFKLKVDKTELIN